MSIKKILFDQFLGSGAYKFTAAYWFIPCLLFVRLYFFIIHAKIFALLLQFNKELEVYFSFILFFVYMYLSYFAVNYSMSMYAEQSVNWNKIVYLRFAFALFFYYFGSLFAKYDLRKFFGNIFAVVALYVIQQQLWVASGNLDFWMQISKYQYGIQSVFSSVVSIAFVYGISDIIKSNQSCSVILGYIGKKSLSILLHHLFGFFLVNYALCISGIINQLDVTGPYYQWNTVHTWPVYIASGVLVSLAIECYLIRPSLNRFNWLDFRRFFGV